MILYLLGLIFFSILFSVIIIIFRKFIAKKIKIVDYPIETRKIHKKPTPLIGGIVIIFNLILVNLYLILSNQITNLDILILMLCIISFLTGLVDDINNISSVKKLIVIGIAYTFVGFFNENFFLKYLYSETFNEFYYLNVLSIFFTILCVLLLVNAFNLSDGINSLAIIISIIWLSYIFICFKNINFSYIIIIISLIIMLPFNFKGKFFLGDSGSLMLGSLI